MQYFKKITLIYAFCLGTFTIVKAQNNNCFDCKCLSEAVVKAIEDKDFDKALHVYRQVSNSSCPYDEMSNLHSRILGLIKEDPTIKSKLKSISLYFFCDNFGLAFDKKTKKYGFIDENLNVRIDYLFDEASPFSYSDFAIVTYEGTKFLIDTLGQKYKVATELNQLDNTVEALVLINKRLTNLPEIVGEHKQLQIVLLNNNKLSTLPTCLMHLTNLRFLDLYSNQLTQLPNELGRLTNLKKLNLNYNNLLELPKEIGNLKQLEYLTARNNQLAQIPKELGQLKELKTLILYDNKLTSLPAEFGLLEKLEALYLGNNSLIKLPNEIGFLSRLIYLEAFNNKISQLPKEVGQLKELRSLGLSVNQLTIIPEEIGNLKNLKNLVLSANQIKNLPKTLGNLVKLQELNLASNQLKELPSYIGAFTDIKEFSIENNQLTALPKEIGNLTKLERLDSDNNHLANLPKEIGNLKKLWALRVHNNKLTEIPNTICNLPLLEDFEAYGNPLKDIPHCLIPLLKKLSVNISGHVPPEIEKKYHLLDGYVSMPPPEIAKVIQTPSDSARQAAEKYFLKKNYKEAYKAILLSTQLDSSNFDKFYSLSFYSLFTGNYQKSIYAAQKTLELNPSAISVESNLALAYLLNNQYKEAEVIYRKWKGKKFINTDTTTATAVFLQDIKDLKAAGVLPKDRLNDVEKIRKLLTE